MNFILRSFLITVFVSMQLPAVADIQEIEPGGVNPLDRKTEFLNNHLIAFSEIKVNSETKKFIAVIPAIGSGKIIVYEVNPSTNALTESATFTQQLYSPLYITFDPSGSHLYGISSTKNIVTQYNYDPASKKFVAAPGAGFQTVCEDRYPFVFDYSRTLQFFPSKNKAYITCQNRNRQFIVDRYKFDPTTGALKTPDVLLGDKNKPESLGESADPLGILIDPSGDYLYIIDRKNTWHEWRQHQLKGNGQFEPADYSFKTIESKTESMTFDPSGKNVYVVAFDNGGNSVIVQYAFDQATGHLIRSNTVNISNIKGKPRAHATHLQFAPAGDYAYALDNKNNMIYQYRVDAKTGKLIALEPAAFIPCTVIRSLVFDTNPASHYAYAAGSNRATVTPQNEKLCGSRKSAPYKLHVDRLAMDSVTGQLSYFVPKP